MKKNTLYVIVGFLIVILFIIQQNQQNQQNDKDLNIRIINDDDEDDIKEPKRYYDSRYITRKQMKINVPTRGEPPSYQQVGILTQNKSGTNDNLILPLMGRRLMMGRDKWQYYAMSDRNNNIKLPISQNGKSCTNEYGCNSLCNGDIVFVEGYNDAFKVTIYENNIPRYIPYI